MLLDTNGFGRFLCVMFQWAPTLEGECYELLEKIERLAARVVSMGTHP